MSQINVKTCAHLSHKVWGCTVIVTLNSCAFTYTSLRCQQMGRDSSVGIATRYDLDGPGIESRWGAIFSAHVRTGPGAHPASCTMGTGSSPGVNRPWRGLVHPPPSSAEVNERVELYLYSPSWPS